ncbi:MAG: FkbM family methyltransferase [Pseudomonadota bacterium]|nr:FkbM family methyltransferase [Pseudomonadota bacterium]
MLYCKVVTSGEVVWDLGANTGIHSMLFSRLVGDKGTVVAFEPLEINVEEIRQTCDLNGATNIRIVSKAISEFSGPVEFHMGHHDKQGSLIGIGSESGVRIQVECATLDEWMNGSPLPDFVKIDIEGAESRALRGFSRVSTSFPTFAIDLHTPAEDVAVGHWLKEHGYRAFRLVDLVARTQGISGSMVQPIQELDRGWPVRTGIWGTIIAVHPSRPEKLATLQSLTHARAA